MDAKTNSCCRNGKETSDMTDDFIFSQFENASDKKLALTKYDI